MNPTTDLGTPHEPRTKTGTAIKRKNELPRPLREKIRASIVQKAEEALGGKRLFRDGESLYCSSDRDVVVYTCVGVVRRNSAFFGINDKHIETFSRAKRVILGVCAYDEISREELSCFFPLSVHNGELSVCGYEMKSMDSNASRKFDLKKDKTSGAWFLILRIGVPPIPVEEFLTIERGEVWVREHWRTMPTDLLTLATSEMLAALARNQHRVAQDNALIRDPHVKLEVRLVRA